MFTGGFAAVAAHPNPRGLPGSNVLQQLVNGAEAWARPQPARAGVCGAAGFLSGWVGRACSVLTHPDKVIKAGKSLATGHPGKAIKAIIGGGGSGASRAVGLAAVTAWVVVGART